jgi:diacylglycerol kinase (ATP)
MATFGIVVNPKSRTIRRDSWLPDRLSREVGDEGIVRAPRSLDELARVLDEFRSSRIDVLGIAGGDGTHHKVLSAMVECYGDAVLPQIALLRGGTMNTVANALQIPRGSPHALFVRTRSALADADREGGPHAVVERRVIRVGDHVGFIVGLGVIAGFLREYYRADDPSPVVATRLLAQAAASACVGGPLIDRITEPVRAKVSLAHCQWQERDYLALAAATVEEIGLGFKPFPRASERPDVFHLLGVFSSAASLARELPKIRRGVPLPAHKAIDDLTHEALIQPDRFPLHYTVDGDLYETHEPLRLSLGPIMRILCPS